jgi:hypothetical protein
MGGNLLFLVKHRHEKPPAKKRTVNPTPAKQAA